MTRIVQDWVEGQLSRDEQKKVEMALMQQTLFCLVIGTTVITFLSSDQHAQWDWIRISSLFASILDWCIDRPKSLQQAANVGE